MRILRALFACALAALSCAALLAIPASATPTATKITVWQAPCEADTCTTAKDRPLASGTIVHGAIQIQVSSATQIGFDWVKLESRPGTTGTWGCFANWSPTANNFWAQIDWTTTRWQACGAGAGDLTRNEAVQFRLRAHEKVGDGETITSPFTVYLNNRPSAPLWAATPVAHSDDDYPHVELKWKANPEPDIVEYHFVRSDPDGSEQEFAVSASNPGGQGCEFTAGSYECIDDAFPSSRYTGRYEYVVLAYRSSPSTAQGCALPPADGCTQSPTGSMRYALLAEPKENPAGAPAPSKRPSSRPSPRVIIVGSHQSSNPNQDLGALPGFEGDPYDPTLPYSQTLPYSGSTPSSAPPTVQSPDEIIVASDTLPVGSESGAGRAMRYIAGGLVLMMGGIHLTRLLRTD